MRLKTLYFILISVLLVGSGLPISSDYPEVGQTPWLFNDEFDSTAIEWDPIPIITQVGGDYRYNVPLGANASTRTYDFQYSGYYDLMIAAKYIADVGDIRIDFGSYVYNFTTWDNLLTDPEGRKYMIIPREKAVALGFHVSTSITVSIYSGTWSSFGMKAVIIQGSEYMDVNPYEFNYLDAGTSEYTTFSSSNGFASATTTNALFLSYGLPSAPFNVDGTHQSKYLGMSVIAGIPEVDSFVDGGTYPDFFSAPALFLESGTYEITLGLTGASSTKQVNITSGGEMKVEIYFETLGHSFLVGSQNARFNDFNTLNFPVSGIPENVEGTLTVSLSIDGMLIEAYSVQRDLFLYLYQFTVFRRAPNAQVLFNSEIIDGSQTVFTDQSTAINGREAILLPGMTTDFRVHAEGNVSRVTVIGKDNLYRNIEINLYVYKESWIYISGATFYSDAGTATIHVPSSFKDSFTNTLLRLEFFHGSSFFRLQGIAIGGPSTSIFEKRKAVEMSRSYANTSIVYDDEGYSLFAESAGLPRPSYVLDTPSFETIPSKWTGGVSDTSASDGIRSVLLSADGKRIISDTATSGSNVDDSIWQYADFSIYDRISFDVKTVFSWTWDNYGSDTSELPTASPMETSSDYDAILFRVKIGSTIIWESSSYFSGWTTITVPISATGPLTFEVIVRSGRSNSQGLVFDPDGNGGLGGYENLYFSVIPHASMWIDNVRITNSVAKGIIASFDYLASAFLNADNRVIFEIISKASSEEIGRHLQLAYRPVGTDTYFTLGDFTILSSEYASSRLVTDISQLKRSILSYGWTQIELVLIPHESYTPLYLSSLQAVELTTQVEGDQFTNIRIDETPANKLQGTRDDREGHHVEWDHATNIYSMKMTELPREHINAKVALSEGGRPSLQQINPDDDMVITDNSGLFSISNPVIYEFRFEMRYPNLKLGFEDLFLDKIPGLTPRLNTIDAYLYKDVPTLRVGSAEHRLMFVVYDSKVEAFLNGIRMGKFLGSFNFGHEPQLHASGVALTLFTIEELVKPNYEGTGVSGNAYGQQKSLTLLSGNHLGYNPIGGELNHAFQTKGKGIENGFWFYVNKPADSSSAVLSIDIKMTGPFQIYIRVTDNVGVTYITYKESTITPYFSNGYLFLPTPIKPINDGKWKTFRVDIQSEIRKYFPSGTVATVEAFLIRGSAMLDNLKFQDDIIMDAEDPSSNVGYVYDTSPTGASMNRLQYNRLVGTVSRGIRFKGSETDNGFWFDVGKQAGINAFLSVDLKINGPFIIFIAVSNDVGINYLRYQEGITTPHVSNGHLFLPLPVDPLNDGNWKTFMVDVQSELQRVYPSALNDGVDGFLIKGSGMVDNLMFQGEMIMDAEDPSENVGYIYDSDPAGATMTNILYSRMISNYVAGNPKLQYFNSYYQIKMEVAFSGQKVYFANPTLYPDPSYIEFTSFGMYKEATLYVDGATTKFFRSFVNESSTYLLAISTYPGREGQSKLSVAFWKEFDLKPIGRSSAEIVLGTPTQGHLLIDLPKNEVLAPYFDSGAGYMRIFEMQDGFKVDKGKLSGMGERFASYWLKQDVINYLYLPSGGYLQVDGNLTHSIELLVNNLFDFNKEYVVFTLDDALGQLAKIRIVRNSTRNKISGALQVYDQGRWKETGLDFLLGNFISLSFIINSTTSTYELLFNGIVKKSYQISRSIVETTRLRLDTKTKIYVSRINDVDFTSSNNLTVDTSGYLDNSIGNSNQYLTVELTATTRTKVVLDFMGQSHEQLIYGEETLQAPVPINQNLDFAFDISSDVPITIKMVSLTTAKVATDFLYLTQGERTFVKQGEVPITPLLDYTFEGNYLNSIADRDHLTYFGPRDHYDAGGQGQGIVLDQSDYLHGYFSYQLPEFTMAFSARFLEDPSLITASNYQFMANAEENGKVLFTILYAPYLSLTVDSSTGARITETSSIPIDNNWHRYVLVYNSSHAILYVDGYKAITILKSEWTAPTPTLFSIGGIGNNDMIVDEYQLFADDYGFAIELLTSFDVPTNAPEFFSGFERSTMDFSGKRSQFFEDSGEFDYGEGIASESIIFNGLTDGATIQTGKIHDFTISIWFKTSKNIGTQPLIFQKGLNSDSLRIGIAIQDNQIRILYSDGNIKTVGTTPISLDTWYHAILTVEGTTVHLYLNGTLISSHNQPLSIPLDEFRIGNIGLFGFQGQMDQLGIYKGILDVNQRIYLNMHKYGIQSSSASYQNLLPTSSFLEPLVYDFQNGIVPETLVGTPYLYADQGNLQFDWQGAPTGVHQTVLNLYGDVFVRTSIQTIAGTSGSVKFGFFLENGTAVNIVEYRAGWQKSSWKTSSSPITGTPNVFKFVRSGSYIQIRGENFAGNVVLEETIYSLSAVQFRILHEKQGSDFPTIKIKSLEVHSVFSKGNATFDYLTDEELYTGVYEVKSADLNETPYSPLAIYEQTFGIGKGLSDLTSYSIVREKKQVSTDSFIPSVPFTPEQLTNADWLSIQYLLPSTGSQSFYLALDVYDTEIVPNGWDGRFSRTQWVRVVLDRNAFVRTTSIEDGYNVISWRDTQSPETSSINDNLFYFTDTNTVIGGKDDIVEVRHPAKGGIWDVVTLDLVSLVQDGTYVGLRALFVDTGGQVMRFIPNWHDASITGLFPAKGVKSSQGNVWNAVSSTETGVVALHNEVYDYRSSRYYATSFAVYVYSETEQRSYVSYESTGIVTMEIGGDRSGGLVPIGLTPGRNLIKFRLIHLPSHSFEWSFKMSVLAPENITISTRDDLDTNVQLSTTLRERQTVATYNQTTIANTAYYSLDGTSKAEYGADMIPIGVTYEPGYNDLGAVLNGNLRIPLQDWMYIKPRGYGMSMWMKPDGEIGTQRIIDGQSWTLDIEYFNSSMSTLRLSWKNLGTWVSVTSKILHGEWGHVAIAFGKEATIFVNGVTTSSPLTHVDSQTRDLYIGSSYMNSMKYAGMVDEIHFFRKELSSNDVEIIRSAGGIPQIALDYEQFGFDPTLSYTFEEGDGIEDNTVDRYVEEFEKSIADLSGSGWTFVQPNANYFRTSKGILELVHTVQGTSEAWYVVDPLHTRIELDFFSNFTKGGIEIELSDTAGARMVSMGYENASPFIRFYNATGTLVSEYSEADLLPLTMEETAIIELRNGTVQASLAGTFSRTLQLLEGRPFGTLKIKFNVFLDQNALFHVNRLETNLPSSIFFGEGIADVVKTFNFDNTRTDLEKDGWTFVDSGSYGWDVVSRRLQYSDPTSIYAEPSVKYDPSSIIKAFDVKLDFSTDHMGSGVVQAYDEMGYLIVSIGFSDGWVASNPKGFVYFYDQTGTIIDSYLTNHLGSSTLSASISVSVDESITANITGSFSVSKAMSNNGRSIDTIKFYYDDRDVLGTSIISFDDLTIHIKTSTTSTHVINDPYPGTFVLTPHTNLDLIQIDDPLEINSSPISGGNGWQASEINFFPDQGFTGFVWNFLYNFAKMGKIHMYVYDTQGVARVLFTIYDAWAGSNPGSHYIIYDETGAKVHNYWSGYNFLPTSGTASFRLKIIGNTLHTNVTGVYSRSSINTFGSISIGSIKIIFTRHATYNAPSDLWKLKPDTSTLSKVIQQKSKWGNPQSGSTLDGNGIYLTDGDVLITPLTSSFGTANFWFKANDQLGGTIMKLKGTSINAKIIPINATHASLSMGTVSKTFWTGAWHMLTLTRSGNAYRLYLDGLMVSIETFTGTPTELQLHDVYEGFNMLIDNYRISQNPFSATSINDLYAVDRFDADTSDDVSILRRIEVIGSAVVDTAKQSTVTNTATINRDRVVFAGSGILSTSIPSVGSSFTIVADLQFASGTQDVLQIQLNPQVSMILRKNDGDLRVFLSGKGRYETVRISGAQVGINQTLYLSLNRHGKLDLSLSGNLVQSFDFTIDMPVLSSMTLTVPSTFEGSLKKLVVFQGILPLEFSERILERNEAPYLTTTGLGALLDFDENDLEPQPMTDVSVEGIVTGDIPIIGGRAVFDGNSNLIIDGDYLYTNNLYLSFRMKANPSIRSSIITLFSISGMTLSLLSGTLTLDAGGQALSQSIDYGIWITVSLSLNSSALLLAIDGKIITTALDVGMLKPSTVAFGTSFKGEIDDLLILTDTNNVGVILSEDQYRRFNEGYLINSWMVSEPVKNSDEFFSVAMRTMPYDGEQIYTLHDKYVNPEKRSVIFREIRHNNGISLAHEDLIGGTAVPFPAWINTVAETSCITHPYEGDIFVVGAACDPNTQTQLKIEMGTQIMALTQFYFGNDLEEDLYLIITLPEYLELTLDELDQNGRAGVSSIEQIQLDDYFWSPFPAQLRDTSYGTPQLGKQMDIRKFVGLDSHIVSNDAMQLIPTPDGVVLHVPRGSELAKAGFHRLGIVLNVMNQTVDDFWDVDVAINQRTDQIGIVTVPTAYRPSVEAISKKTVSGYMSEKGGFNDFEKDLAGKRVANRYFYFDKAGRVHTLTEYIMGVTDYDTVAEVGKVNSMWVTDAGTDHMESAISQAVIGKSSFTSTGSLSHLSTQTPLAGEIRLQGQGYPTIIRASNRLEAIQAMDIKFFNSKVIKREGYTAIEVQNAFIKEAFHDVVTIVISEDIRLFPTSFDGILSQLVADGLAKQSLRNVNTVETLFFQNGTIVELPVLKEIPSVSEVQWQKTEADLINDSFSIYFLDERFTIEFDEQVHLLSTFGNRHIETMVDLSTNFFTVQDTAFAENVVDTVESQYFIYDWEAVSQAANGNQIASRLSKSRLAGFMDWVKAVKPVAKNPLEAISNAMDAVGDGIRKGINSMTGTVNELRQTAKDTIEGVSSVVDNAVNHAVQVGQAIGQQLLTIAVGAVTLTQNVISQTMDALEVFGKYMAKTGEALKDSLVNGLANLVEFIRNVSDAVNDWFGSLSPKQFLRNLIALFKSGEKADELKDKELSTVKIINGSVIEEPYSEFAAVRELTESLDTFPNAHTLITPVDPRPKLILSGNHFSTTGSTTFRIEDSSSVNGRYQLVHNNERLIEGTWAPGTAITLNLPYTGTYQLIAYDDEGNRVEDILTVDGYNTQDVNLPDRNFKTKAIRGDQSLETQILDLLPSMPIIHPQDASELHLILTHYMKMKFLMAYAIIMGSGIGVYETSIPTTRWMQPLFHGADDIDETVLAQYGINSWTKTKGTEYVLKLDELLDRLVNAFAGGGWEAIISQSSEPIENGTTKIAGTLPSMVQVMQYRLAQFLSGGLIVNATQSSNFSPTNGETKPVFDFRRDIDGTPLPFGREYIIFVDDSDPKDLDFYMPIHKSMRFGTQTWVKWLSEYFMMVTLEIILGMLPVAGLKDDIRDSFLESEATFRWLARFMIPQDLVDIGFFGFNPVAKVLKGTKSFLGQASTFVGTVPSKAGGVVKQSTKLKSLIGMFEKFFIVSKPNNLEIATSALSGMSRGPFAGLTKTGVVTKALGLSLKYIIQFIFKGISYAIKLKFVTDFIKIVFKMLKTFFKGIYWLVKGVVNIVKSVGSKATDLGQRLLAKTRGVMGDLWTALSGAWSPSIFDFVDIKAGTAFYDETAGVIRHVDGGLFTQISKKISDVKGVSDQGIKAIGGFLTAFFGVFLNNVKPIVEFGFTLVKKVASGTGSLLKKYWNAVTAEPDGYGLIFKNKEKMDADRIARESKLSNLPLCTQSPFYNRQSISQNDQCNPVYSILNAGGQAIHLMENFPIDETIKNQLKESKLFGEEILQKLKSVTLNDIIERKLGFLFYYVEHLTFDGKLDPLYDPLIHKYFGTKSQTLLKEYLNVIKTIQNPKLSTFRNEGIITNSPIFQATSFGKFKDAKAESIHKFIETIYEREFASLSFLKTLEGGESFPLSSFLREFPTGQPTYVFEDFVPFITDENINRLKIMYKEMYGNDIEIDVNMYKKAFTIAMNKLQTYSLNLNEITRGNDGMGLVLPKAKEILQDSTLDDFTKMIVDKMLSSSNKNLLKEMKLTSTGRPSIKSIAKKAKDIKANSRAKIFYGNFEDFPNPVKYDKNSIVVTVFGLGRLDSLKRDWSRIGYHFNLKTEMFKTNLISQGIELSKDTVKTLASNEFKDALAETKFNKKFSELPDSEKELIDDLLLGIATKMENSIAQHQLMEFFRTGRWPEVDNLGYMLPFHSTVNEINIVQHNQIPDADLGKLIQNPITIPFKINDIEFDLLVTPQTTFDVEIIDGIPRFGFTKYIDQNGLVQRIPIHYLDYVSIPNVDDGLFTQKPTRKSVEQIRNLQEQIFGLVFRTDGIGHPSNYMNGVFNPEKFVLEYTGVGLDDVEKMLKTYRSSIPKNFDMLITYDRKMVPFAWEETKRASPKNSRIQITAINMEKKVPVTFSKNGKNVLEWVTVKGYEESSPHIKSNVIFVNKHSISRKIKTLPQFAKTVIPEKVLQQWYNGEMVRSSARLRNHFATVSVETKVKWFLSLGVSHQSSPRAVPNIGRLPTPIDFTTIDPITGSNIPQNLISIGEITEESDMFYVFFRPPSRYSKQVVNNEPLTPALAKKVWNLYDSESDRIRGLMPYYDEIVDFLSDKSIEALQNKYPKQNPAYALILELEQFKNGMKDNLVPLKFKSEFNHLTIPYVFGGPDFEVTPIPEIFTVKDIRVAYGQFIMSPAAIGYRSEELLTYISKPEVFKDPEVYQNYLPTYLEALLRRIRKRLTLDAELLKQNFEAWKSVKISTHTVNQETIPLYLKDLIDHETLWELAIRRLAHGHTIIYDENGKRTIVKNSAFYFSNFAPPQIFLDDNLLNEKNNFEIMRNVIDQLGLKGKVKIEFQHLKKLNKVFDEQIDTISNLAKNKNIQELINLIFKTRNMVGSLIRLMKIVFTKV